MQIWVTTTRAGRDGNSRSGASLQTVATRVERCTCKWVATARHSPPSATHPPPAIVGGRNGRSIGHACSLAGGWPLPHSSRSRPVRPPPSSPTPSRTLLNAPPLLAAPPLHPTTPQLGTRHPPPLVTRTGVADTSAAGPSLSTPPPSRWRRRSSPGRRGQLRQPPPLPSSSCGEVWWGGGRRLHAAEPATPPPTQRSACRPRGWRRQPGRHPPRPLRVAWPPPAVAGHCPAEACRRRHRTHALARLAAPPRRPPSVRSTGRGREWLAPGRPGGRPADPLATTATLGGLGTRGRGRLSDRARGGE